MSGRSSLFVLILIAAFVAPYFLSQHPPDKAGPMAAWWDSMWTNSFDDLTGANDYPSPVAAASPLPGGNGYAAFPSSPAYPPPNSLLPSASSGLMSANPLTGSSGGPTQASLPYPSAPNSMASSSVTPHPLAAYPSANSTPLPRGVYSTQQGTNIFQEHTVESGRWVTVGPAPPGTTSSGGAVAAMGGGPTVISGPTVIGVVPGRAGSLPIPVPAAKPAATSGQQQSAPAPSPHQNLADLLNFDISPQWIASQWPRVSTQLIDSGLAGMRVPLVSGTSVEDLAGSLSYYFDPQQQLKRISFVGTTGDPTQLVSYLVQQFGMQAETALGGGMFVARTDGKLSSALRLRQSPIVRQSQPLRRYQIQLELNHPATGQGLSPEYQTMLDDDQKSRRWLPQPLGAKASPLESQPPVGGAGSSAAPAATPSPSNPPPSSVPWQSLPSQQALPPVLPRTPPLTKG